MMISAEEAKANVKEYKDNYIYQDINYRITKLSKEGKSYLGYCTGDLNPNETNKLIEMLISHGYHVINNDGYFIEITW